MVNNSFNRIHTFNISSKIKYLSTLLTRNYHVHICVLVNGNAFNKLNEQAKAVKAGKRQF